MTVRMRHTKGHTANRRSHHALSAERAFRCVQCGTPHRAHRMCGTCGNYRGKAVVDVAAKEAKRIARKQERAKEMGVDPSTVAPQPAEAKDTK